MIQSTRALFTYFLCSILSLLVLFVLRVFVANDKLLHKILVRDVLQAVRVICIAALHTNQEHLVHRIPSAHSAVVARTAERARMQIWVHDKARIVPHTRHVIKAPAVMLCALDQRLRHHVVLPIAVDKPRASKKVDEQLDVVITQPLLVERECALPALSDHVALLSFPMADEALSNLRSAGSTLPL